MKHIITRLAGTLLLLAAMVGCDAASDLHDGEAEALPAGVTTTGRTSPVDGRPILQMTEEALYEGTYLAQLRAALQARGPALRTDLERLQARKGADGAPLYVADVLAAAGKAGGDAPSSHVVVTDVDGGEAELVFTIEPLGTFGEGPALPDGCGGDGGWQLADGDCGDPSYSVLIDSPDDLVDVPDGGRVSIFTRAQEDPNVQVEVVVGELGVVRTIPAGVTVYTINVESQDEVIEGSAGPQGALQAIDDRYLALSQIRLENNGESGAAELVMTVQATDDYDTNFPARWSYFFDRRKTFEVEWTEVGRFLGAVVDKQDTDSLMRVLYQAVKIGRTRRVQAADGAIYEVPDVDDEGRTYSFAGMPSWGLKGKSNGDRADYFPLLHLSDQDYRLILIEKDETFPWYKYKRYSRRRKDDAWVGDVKTYDFESGTVQNVETGVDGRKHRFGSSDDIIEAGALRRMNAANTERLLNGNMGGAIRLSMNDAFYELRTVNNRMIVAQ